MDDLKAFLQGQMRNAYAIKEGQIEQMRLGLMREAERFFILQRRNVISSMFMFQPQAARV